MKVDFLGKIILGVIVLSMHLCQAQKKKKPNVIVIYTDDHRYTGIHELGGMPVKTPNIDKLAKNGVVFTNTYLMGAFSGATCMPSRAMLHTGRQLFKLKGKGRELPVDHHTMGETFQNSGYQSHIIGKWHQDRGSLSRSFDSGDHVMGIGVYLTDHYRMPLWDWDKKGVFPKKDAYLIEFDEKGKEKQRPIVKTDKRGPTGTEKLGPHTSEIFARDAVNYIKKYKKRDPFFMYLAFHAPHDPRQAPQKYKDMYPIDQMELTPSYQLQHSFDNGDMVLRDEALAPWPRTEQVAKEHLASYYAIITHLDAQIGKVIAALKKTGKYENTLIVLAGDSGLAVGNHGLMGKQSLYDEDGIHVPFIISGGAAPNSGKRLGAYSYIHDIFPTICDLVQIPIPNSVDGLSMLPVIKGEQEQVREYTYHAYKQFQRAYRRGDYKLIEYVRSEGEHYKKGKFTAGSRVTQLFNFKKDPWETKDLSFLPEYRSILDSMKKEMIEKAIELKDKEGNTLGVKYDFWQVF